MNKEKWTGIYIEGHWKLAVVLSVKRTRTDMNALRTDQSHGVRQWSGLDGMVNGNRHEGKIRPCFSLRSRKSYEMGYAWSEQRIINEERRIQDIDLDRLGGSLLDFSETKVIPTNRSHLRRATTMRSRRKDGDGNGHLTILVVLATVLELVRGVEGS